ncbi:hypothetical protein EDD68_1191 [Melghiribacillus thermohalophilus]|uniref:Uncharacterized protein n=2 Tax=Melghiribacillus thermohalophilus TaxID=1324956 RepID=A0A4R3MSV0_9BACI|nr:hypothetical protein EDD68_1191 [Melghiribacillus thermohalophilus]
MMMEFLYFPENKMEYIPAIISLAIFFLGAVFTMKVILKVSRREEEKLHKDLENVKKET